MIPPLNQNRNHPDSSPGSAEETLRIIATLPAPEGLAERVHAGLRAAPPRTSTIVVPWPSVFRPQGNFVRGAAAAAIVCIVAGGGWRIYSHIPPPAGGVAPNLMVMPQRPASGGFGAANARHVPQTLEGPVLVQHAMPGPQAENVKAGSTAKPIPAGPKSRKKIAHAADATAIH